ncbi:LacI family DNA-binding transcriptional regulator [Clostridium sp. YIM B02515]|uniref:LacI family DNA-binding transcriptional regulator n=1 Tax=Clostridium rhizosphaerae TaxID=2803861 RepID=A0ABS1TA03_9CLOT|nr:LacI family DNA-binding transcriptional regulator [Clostridium rhizosphaerae]MBL4936174.1 LacI family DNA-binding transcriptional regulator [Clostridium rhizosphaerae]
MRKVTMQDLADALKVSRVTVWKVFNDYPGVSEPLRNEIITKALEMGYLKSEQPTSTEQQVNITEKDDPITVSVVVSRPDTSMFWISIIHCIAKQLAKDNINLMYTYLPSKYNDSYTLPAVLSNGTVQGMIVLNVYDIPILQMLNKLRIPKVFLDIVTSIPEDTLTGDLLLLEGHNTIRKITNSIIEKGRTEIGFIGPTDYARTNQDRYEGFLSAMSSNNLPVNSKLCLTGNIGIDTYQEEINQFLSGLHSMPQAFVCVNDFVANLVLQYLNEHKIQVPKDVAITGYDGITEHGDLTNYLTTVQVDLNALGKRLVRQLLYRINDPDSPYEIIYISFDVSFGDSTNF